MRIKILSALVAVTFVVQLPLIANSFIAFLNGGAAMCVYDPTNKSSRRVNNVPLGSNCKEVFLGPGNDEKSFWATYSDEELLVISHYNIDTLKLIERYEIPQISEFPLGATDQCIFLPKTEELIVFLKYDEKRIIKYNVKNFQKTFLYTVGNDVSTCFFYKVDEQTILITQTYPVDYKKNRQGIGKNSELLLLNINTKETRRMEWPNFSPLDVISISDDGKYLLLVESLNRLLLVDLHELKIIKTLCENGYTYDGDFSPQSNQLIYAVDAKRLFVVNPRLSDNARELNTGVAHKILTPSFINKDEVAFVTMKDSTPYITTYQLLEEKEIAQKQFRSIASELFIIGKYIIFDE